MAIEIVGIHTVILKIGLKIDDHEFTKRVCKIVDEIHKEEDIVWEFSNEEKDGEILISFLKRSPVKGYIPQINSIIRSGGIPYSLVNFSSKYETNGKFNKLFHMLPKIDRIIS